MPTTATRLAHTSGIADKAAEPTDQLIGARNPEAADTPFPRPGAHSGATLGSAVHGVLELLDLAAPTEHAVNLAVAAACSETGLPQLAGEVRPLVQSALRAPTVQLAGTCRHRKEVPIIADIGGRTVEDVIDLLVETPDGMVVIDYKTDTVRSAAERAAKAAAYAPQITAYTRAVTQAGRHVHQALLCFIAKNAVIEVPVPARPQ